MQRQSGIFSEFDDQTLCLASHVGQFVELGGPGRLDSFTLDTGLYAGMRAVPAALPDSFGRAAPAAGRVGCANLRLWRSRSHR